MKNLPSLTLADIREWVGQRSFERARPYTRGALFNQRRQGATLKAQCQGSLPHPYNVQVMLGPAGISAADCSCPVGDGGACKHAGALLMAWLADPAEFVELEELQSALERRSKPELIALMRQMIARYPDLELLLELPTPGAASATKPLNPKVIQQQIAAVLSGGGDQWGASYGIAQALESVTRLGQEYLLRNDAFNAAIVYETAARDILEHYEELGDEEGDIGEVVNECVSGLATCLDKLSERGQRESVLRSLFDIYIWDIEYGGIGIGENVPAALAEQTSPDERASIVEWLRDELPAGKDFHQSWRRQALGGLLLDLQRDTLDDETFLRTCRETGRTRELIARLLDLNRLDEALREIRSLDDHMLLEMAMLVRAKGHASAGEQLVRERLPKAQQADQLLEWLRNLASERGDAADALQFSQTLFWRQPTLPRYEQLLRQAEQRGGWPELRAELLERLAAEGKYTLLTEIHLQANEVAEALQTLPQVTGWGVYGAIPLHLRVAQAAEQSHPFEAIELYIAAAEQLIKQQGRENYASAARYLARVRDIYQHLSQPEPWQQLIASIRQQNKRLRALQEELTRAGL